MQPTLTTSTPLSLASTKRPLSLALPPSSSAAPSGLAGRRRNNKNLSLCLSSSSSAQMFADLASPTFARPENQSTNPYHNGPACIMPFLYLGAESNAADLDQLRKYHIQCLLNLAAEVHNPHEHLFQPLEHILHRPSLPSPSLPSPSHQDPSLMGYKKLPWQHQQANLATELEIALEAIDRARETGQSILVHCQCGVARSATVIVAYVIKTLRLPLQEAYDYVKARAPAISPNLGLLYQLREFEQKTLRPQNQTYSVPPTPTLAIFSSPKSPSRLSSLSFAWKRKVTKPTPEPKKSVCPDQSVESWWRLKQSPKTEPDVSTCC